ncbi:DNA methyltransferase [Lentibacillus populi]|uniref:DNA methyltransferase n=1 Tax=Lentibacillus populi TaxID=1827502 RepID=A0A9W5TX64_9BACI|nr:DNA adenine methylase [Lentibacillus populi]GGB41533.1 DNA methyltransferase [Lentibacillus populi]
MKVKSPLIWFGGKANMADSIISLMPEHKCYVEPFGGAAHVLASKPKSKVEVYNDINGDAVNFLMVLRKDPDKLYDACSTLPYSRYLYELWQDELFDQRRNGGDMCDFDRAVKFFYVNRCAINGGGQNHKSGWKHSAHHNTPGVYQQVCKRIVTFAERLKGVIIDCDDFSKVIQTYDDKDSLFYVDPPYFGNESRYKGGFQEKDHRYLAALLNRINGKAIVSYYDHDLIDKLYPGWNRLEIKTKKTMISTKDGYMRPDATELLLMNFEDSQMNLFEIS